MKRKTDSASVASEQTSMLRCLARSSIRALDFLMASSLSRMDRRIISRTRSVSRIRRSTYSIPHSPYRHRRRPAVVQYDFSTHLRVDRTGQGGFRNFHLGRPVKRSSKFWVGQQEWCICRAEFRLGRPGTSLVG